MYIKTKLIQQLGVQERIQESAITNGDLRLAADISNVMLEYIKCVSVELDNEDEAYTCPDCEKAMAEEMLHQEIADTSGLPIELVKRVLARQAKVLGMR